MSTGALSPGDVRQLKQWRALGTVPQPGADPGTGDAGLEKYIKREKAYNEKRMKTAPHRNRTTVSRRRAVAAALGSLRLEGLEPDGRTRALLERYARGELTDDELERLAVEQAGGATRTGRGLPDGA